jgi:hypothetical protein
MGIEIRLQAYSTNYFGHKPALTCRNSNAVFKLWLATPFRGGQREKVYKLNCYCATDFAR